MDETLDLDNEPFFTPSFRNMYYNIQRSLDEGEYDTTRTSLPRILKFSTDNMYQTYISSQKKSSNKYSVKNLLNTSIQNNDISLIFNRTIQNICHSLQSNSNDKNVKLFEKVSKNNENTSTDDTNFSKENVANDVYNINHPTTEYNKNEEIKKEIQQEKLECSENFIEIDNQKQNLPEKVENVQCFPEKYKNNLNKKISDLSSRKVRMEKVEKVDYNNSIVDDGIQAVKNIEDKMDGKKDIKSDEKPKFPDLTVDEINTSLKVVGDLSPGSKLKIIDNRYLAEDNSYIQSIARYSSGQSRENLINFLNHLFSEIEKKVRTILFNIRNGIDVDNNISILQGIVGKIFVFLHKYENMRSVYKSDSSAFARLGIIRDKFFTFMNTLFREMTIPSE